MGAALIKLLPLWLCLLLSAVSYGQGKKLEGVVIDAADSSLLTETHVVNKRSLKGTMTNAAGSFSISIELGDTVVFSNIAYKYFYFIYRDSTTQLRNVRVEMEEQNYLLHEVSIFAYELTTNDPVEMKVGKPDIPPSEGLEDGRIVEATLANPADYLYNLFGSKPRQLRRLAELKAEDAYREKLRQGDNRQLVSELTGLTIDELEAFMFYCKYTRVQMNTLNDYDFFLAVRRCYTSYVREKELEEFLNQF